MTVAIPYPCLALVTDRKRCRLGLEESVRAAIEGGVDLVQLREKDLEPALLLTLARRMRALTEGKALFVVNGGVDLALACGADGVHFPEHAGSIAEARGSLGAGRLIGRSIHDGAAAESAGRDGADYLFVGTIYATSSKPGVLPAGPDRISQASRATKTPLLAIGGVTTDKIPELLGSGAFGAAVCAAILGAEDPGRAARELKAALRAASAARPLVAVTVNGQRRAVPEGLSLQAYLQELGLSSRPVAVAINGEIVSPASRETRAIRQADAIDIVHAVAGG